MTADTTNAVATAVSKTDNAGEPSPRLLDGASAPGSRRLPADVPAGSRLAHLKAQRDERLKVEQLKIPVPTWKGDLLAVFRPMSIEERKDFSGRMSGGSYDEVTVGAEFIAACCTGVELRSEDGSFAPVMLDSGAPAMLDPVFAKSLGYEAVSTGAGCVQSLVNWNVAAVEGMFEKLHNWSRDTSMEIEGAIVGE